MSNDHVTKPDASAFDDMHPIWKVFWVVAGAFLLLFWAAVVLSVL